MGRCFLRVLQHEVRALFVFLEFLYLSRVGPKNVRELTDAAIPPTDPDDLRRSPVQEAHLLEVVVLRHDREPSVPRMDPDLAILRFGQPDVPDMRRPRKEVGQGHREPRREVLVEEKLQELRPGAPTSASALDPPQRRALP